jgi:hypothetical protein
MQVRFFIYKSNCDFDPSHPSVFLSNTPNLKKKKKANETLGGISLLLSINQRCAKILLHSTYASYKHTNNAALKPIFM